jgi:hypothetical protein
MFDLDKAIRDAWPVFREATRQGRTITYTELAGRAGPPLTRRNLHRQLLNALSERCRRAGLPDLSALVVRKDSGFPGGGWWVVEAECPTAEWAEALAACWAHPWPARPPAALLGRGEPAGAGDRIDS